MARFLKSTHFGVELIHYQILSFGIAPAVIVYLWTKSLFIETTWSMVIFYAICSSSRLAKFNISTTEKDTKVSKLKFFSGISTPAAAGLSLLPMMINFRFNLDFFMNESFMKIFFFFPAILT